VDRRKKLMLQKLKVIIQRETWSQPWTLSLYNTVLLSHSCMQSVRKWQLFLCLFLFSLFLAKVHLVHSFTPISSPQIALHIACSPKAQISTSFLAIWPGSVFSNSVISLPFSFILHITFFFSFYIVLQASREIILNLNNDY
jgi:hypothetical protein